MQENKNLKNLWLSTTIKQREQAIISISGPQKPAVKKLIDEETNERTKQILEELHLTNRILVTNELQELVLEKLYEALNGNLNYETAYNVDQDIKVIKARKRDKKILELSKKYSNETDPELKQNIKWILMDLYNFGMIKLSKEVKNLLMRVGIKFKELELHSLTTKLKKIYEKLKFKASIRIERWQLKQMQGLPLDLKIIKTMKRIQEWYEYWDGDVYVSFSGGKDSLVLLHLVRSMYPEVPAVYCDTGLEYPELREFVKTIENVIWIKPSMQFKEVINTYGYPIISKENAFKIRKLTTQNLTEEYRNYLMNGDERGSIGMLPKKHQYLLEAPFKISEQCCDVTKKIPFKIFEKETNLKAFIGTMAAESKIRETRYLEDGGCNAFHTGRPISTPIGFWMEQDILQYIAENTLEIAAIYGQIQKDSEGKYFTTGVKRSGCMWCMFGVQNETAPNRFQQMAQSHPRIYDYCINKLGLGEVLDYINVPYKVENGVYESEEKKAKGWKYRELKFAI